MAEHCQRAIHGGGGQRSFRLTDPSLRRQPLRLVRADSIGRDLGE